MELNELIRKIATIQSAAKARLTAQSSEKMQAYIQGYSDGLDGVVTTIRKALEAEKMRQRLARLESELAQEPEPDWSLLPEVVTASTHASRTSTGKAGQSDSSPDS